MCTKRCSLFMLIGSLVTMDFGNHLYYYFLRLRLETSGAPPMRRSDSEISSASFPPSAKLHSRLFTLVIFPTCQARFASPGPNTLMLFKERRWWQPRTQTHPVCVAECSAVERVPPPALGPLLPRCVGLETLRDGDAAEPYVDFPPEPSGRAACVDERR